MMTLPTGTKTQIKKIKICGFTLIELIIVAAIILVLIAVSTPLFRGAFKGLKLKDAAYSVGKIIQYAQQKAIIGGEKYRLIFDFDKRAYRLLAWDKKEDGGDFSARGGADFGWKEITGRFGGYFYLPEGVRFKGDKDAITFLPNGRCDKIKFYVIDEENKTFAIKTNGKAGHVEVFEVRNK